MFDIQLASEAPVTEIRSKNCMRGPVRLLVGAFVTTRPVRVLFSTGVLSPPCDFYSFFLVMLVYSDFSSVRAVRRTERQADHHVATEMSYPSHGLLGHVARR